MSAEREELALLLAERAITRVLHRYARGVDRYHMDVVRSCYWDDATDSHAPLFDGSADDYVQWLSAVLPGVESISHQFTNVLIDVAPSGASADAESYCLNAVVPRRRNGAPPARQIQCLRYLDRFEKRGSEWRILRREVVRDWCWHLDPAAFVVDPPRQGESGAGAGA
jgi:hypothetical protein